MFVSSGSGPRVTHSIRLGYQQSTNNSVKAVFEIGPLAGSEFVSLVSRVGMCHWQVCVIVISIFKQ